MRPLPADSQGPDNDLDEMIGAMIMRAKEDQGARLYAFGGRWGPRPDPDAVFGFEPGNGVHDIHMNQGNAPCFARDDGVWQDGALLMHFPGAGRWVGLFLAFQSQAWHTDDVTGHALGGSAAPAVPGVPPRAPEGSLAAMVNPVGPAPERERVLLLNASPDAVDLSGWQIADRLMRTCPLPAQSLEAGSVLEVAVSEPAQLGNKGGSITLLDAGGLKVAGALLHGRAGGPREGWTITF